MSLLLRGVSDEPTWQSAATAPRGSPPPCVVLISATTPPVVHCNCFHHRQCVDQCPTSFEWIVVVVQQLPPWCIAIVLIIAGASTIAPRVLRVDRHRRCCCDASTIAPHVLRIVVVVVAADMDDANDDWYDTGGGGQQ